MHSRVALTYRAEDCRKHWGWLPYVGGVYEYCIRYRFLDMKMDNKPSKQVS
jgi:hypothetical protein